MSESKAWVTDADYQRYWLGREVLPVVNRPAGDRPEHDRRSSGDRRSLGHDRRWDGSRGRRFRARRH